MDATYRVIWSHDCTDYAYDVPVALVLEFCHRIKNDGMDSAWDWFISNVDYGADGDAAKPIAHNTCLANHDFVEIGLDHEHPEEFVEYVEFLKDE